jgi:mono/diheme cytochrome c family protein
MPKAICCGALLLAATTLCAQTPGGSTATTAGPTSAAHAHTVPAGDAGKGKKIYVTYGCYQCHGYVGQGGSGVLGGPRLAPHPLAFEAFTKQLRHPRYEMPPYTEKVASEQDLADIYAFLLSIPPPPPVSSIPLLSKGQSQ